MAPTRLPRLLSGDRNQRVADPVGFRPDSIQLNSASGTAPNYKHFDGQPVVPLHEGETVPGDGSFPITCNDCNLPREPCPTTIGTPLDVFVQWGLSPLTSYQPHTYLTTLNKTAPLVRSIQMLKAESLPGFLRQHKSRRLLLAILGKTVIGTALMLANGACAAHLSRVPRGCEALTRATAQETARQMGMVAKARVHAFTKTSLLTYIWNLKGTLDDDQHQAVSQLDTVQQHMAQMETFSTSTKSDNESVVLVIRILPDEIKIATLLISFGVLLSLVIGVCTASMANGMAAASAVFALYSSVHPMVVLIRSHDG